MKGEDYQLYDAILQEGVKRIFDIAKEDKHISIEYTDDTHPLMWQLLVMYKTFYNAPVYINMNWFKARKFRKQWTLDFGRESKYPTNIQPKGFLHQLADGFDCDVMVMDDIYDTYYRKD